jgi:hypothetical protein
MRRRTVHPTSETVVDSAGAKADEFVVLLGQLEPGAYCSEAGRRVSGTDDCSKNPTRWFGAMKSSLQRRRGSAKSTPQGNLSPAIGIPDCCPILSSPQVTMSQIVA